MKKMTNVNFHITFRCTEVKHAKNFVDKGQIKFGTPQSWVDWELRNGKGRGDLLEGTVAYCNIFDVEQISKFHQKYSSSETENLTLGNTIYMKRKRSMNLPVFCFYILKDESLKITPKEEKQDIETIIPYSYFRDFADDMSPEQIDKLSEGDKPAVIIINNFNEFRKRLVTKLLSFGLKEDDIIFESVVYNDYHKNGEDGWGDFLHEQPYELFSKDESFYNQSEGRVVINTDNESIKKILHEPIDIGSLKDISQYITKYFYDGMLIKLNGVSTK